MLESYKDILTPKDICEILGSCKTTVYKQLNANIIPNRVIGKKIYISKELFIKYLNSSSVS